MSVALVSAELCDKVSAASRIALYLDFDGTLSPIVTHHEDAQLPEPVRDTLLRLALDRRFVIAIVSGRAIADLRRRVGIPGLVYAGNHGLEIEGFGLSFRAKEASASEGRLAGAAARLRGALRSIPGAEVENKGLTASVHFRRVEPAQRGQVYSAVRETVPVDDPELVLRDAKMVIEIRPRVRWNKGEGVLWIRRELGLESAFEIYIGDDTTDEDAFALLPEAFTVHVGTGPTAARYRLADTGEVAVLLKCVLDNKETHGDAG
jgi:trehalose 6-phosphate phosphatase